MCSFIVTALGVNTSVERVAFSIKKKQHNYDYKKQHFFVLFLCFCFVFLESTNHN